MIAIWYVCCVVKNVVRLIFLINKTPIVTKKLNMMFLKKLSKRLKLGFILFVILLIGGACFGGLCWMLFKVQSNPKWWMLLIFVVFFTLIFFKYWVYKHCKWKALKFFCNIICAPLSIIAFVAPIMHPFITIIGVFVFLAFFCFGFFAFLLFGLNHALNFGLHPEAICFITIAVGSILCSNSHKISKIVVRCSFLRNNGEHRYEEYRERLAMYLIQPRNMIFLLYLIYVILLAISGFMQIQYGGYLFSVGYDNAILKAFLVFIAFTNMKSKAQDSELDARELLKQTLGLFVHDDEDWLKQRFNVKDS